MTRMQRNLMFAAVLGIGGGGVGIYTLVAEVKTPEERHAGEIEKQRLFRFGNIHVKQLKLFSKNATVAITLEKNSWQIREPFEWRADSVAIIALLDRMAGVRLDPIVTEEATATELTQQGFDRPLARIEVDVGDKWHVLIVAPKNRLTDQYPVTDGAKKKIGMALGEPVWAFDRPADDLREKRLFPIDPEDVVRFERQGASPLSLAFADGKWAMGDTGGDPGLIGLYLVRFTKHLKVERWITDALDATPATSRASYGLDKPIATVTIESKDGQKFSVEFASYLETGAEEGTLVAHLIGSKSVVKVNQDLRPELEKEAGSLRDRTMTKFDRANVARIEIQIGKNPLFGIDRAANGWTLDEAKKRPAIAWKIENLVLPYSGLRADDLHKVEATPMELRRWKLEPPSRRVVIKDDKGATLADVSIGDYADDANLYARVGSEKRVFLLRDTKVKIIPQSPADLVQ